MKKRFLVRLRQQVLSSCLTACVAVLMHQSPAQANQGDPPNSTREGAWLNTQKDGYIERSRVVKLTPQAEAKPALRYELLPQPFDMVEGNAAIDYLTAMGFLEQTAALEAKRKFERDGWKEVEGTDNRPEPDVWMATLPSELPVEKVKKYLSYTKWQQRYLERARTRKDCSFDRNIRSVENPSGTLLPEIQTMRQMARTQSMRSRLAIREGRPEDAFKIFGQQLAMARHLNQEPFLVSNLVGMACALISINDAYFLSEHRDAPNMYWALTTLPRPLVSMKSSMSFERDFVFQEFKQLKLVDEEPRPAGYWQQVVKELSLSLKKTYLAYESESSNLGHVEIATLLATSYPSARAFLLNETPMTAEQIDALPNSQVVLLGIRRMHEFLRDEYFKLHYLQYHERSKLASPDKVLEEATKKYGMLTSISDVFLPAIEAASTAADRLEAQIGLLRTVESIRDHLAVHHKLPSNLDELRLPVPNDPRTGKPFSYQVANGTATLTSSIMSNTQIKLMLDPNMN